MRRSIWTGGRPWYELVVTIVVAVTAAIRIAYSIGIGDALLALERRVVEALLAAQGIGVYTVSYNTFIAYTGKVAITLKIVPSCSSAYPIIAFTVIGLILPRIPLRSRVEALILYPPILFALNVARVVATASVGLRAGVREFQVLHDYLGTILGILFFGLLWIHWFSRAVQPLTPPPSIKATQLAAVAILVAALIPVPLAHAAPAQVAILVTDEPDQIFAEHWSQRSGTLPQMITLGDLASGAWQGEILVLLDPNYDQGDVEKAREAVRRVIEHLEAGKPVVASLNGVSMLRLGGLLDDYNISCPSLDVEPLPGYDTASYCLAIAPPYVEQVDLGGPTLYLHPSGRSVIVVVPYNLVWAYNSTGHKAYLDLLSRAVELAQSYSQPSRIPLAALAAALAAAAGAASQMRSREEGGGGGHEAPAASLLGYRRVGGEDVWNNPVRRRIVEMLAEEPLHFNELWRRLGVAKATLAWHLSILEREGIVSILRYKRYKIVYLAGDEDSVLKVLARDRPRDVCVMAQAALGGGLEEAARKLRTRPQALEAVYTMVVRYLDEVLEWCIEQGVG